MDEWLASRPEEPFRYRLDSLRDRLKRPALEH